MITVRRKATGPAWPLTLIATVLAVALSSLSLQSNTTATATSLLYFRALVYTTGAAPDSVAAADFNGDGFPDLAVANWQDNTVTVLLSKGDGTFISKDNYATGVCPSSVAVGDFNHDTHPDLAVANWQDSTVSVLINNGNGTFGSKSDFATTTGPYSVAVADFDGDKHPDLAATGYRDNRVSVLLNQGDGTFAQKVDYATGFFPCSVAAADLNDDKSPDLVVTNNWNDDVSVLINNGNGTFKSKVDYATEWLSSVVVDYLNDDLFPDLAVTNNAEGTLSVLINNGNGTFKPKVDYTTGSLPKQVAVGFFNDDLFPDLVVANNLDDTLSVLLNNGNGTFGVKMDYATGSGPCSVAAGDFNRDFWDDVAVANWNDNTISVLFNNGYSPPPATLTVTKVGNGTVTKFPDLSYYNNGTEVILTAKEDLGWTFSHWSGDASGSSASTTVTMNGDKTVTATFSENTYNLTISKVGNGTVTADIAAPYHYNDVVNMSAVADPGWTFSGWSGDASGTSSSTTITMNGNKAVTATFTQEQYTLSTYANPIGSGSVSKSPDKTTYTYGEVVTLTATANPGYTFSYWSFDATGSVNPTTVTMNGHKSVTAHFYEELFSLTVNVVGQEGGSVSRSPDQTTYTTGTVVTLTATANVGWTFTGWSGDAGGSALTTTVTMNSNKTVTATFTKNTYTLTYIAGPNGTISGTTLQVVAYGDSGTPVTAVPAAGYHFQNWSDGSTANPRTDTSVTSNITVTANFLITYFQLTYTAGPNGSIGGNASQVVPYGGSGTAVSAVPAAGYQFVNWSDGRTDTPRVDSNVTNNISVTASFAQTVYTLTYTAGAHGGIAGASPQNVASGGSGTPVTAVPETGYHFVNWSDGSTANPRTDTNVQASLSVTANFAINTYTLTYLADNHGTIVGASPQTVNHGGSGTAVNAAPGNGYHFVNWTDGKTANPRTDTNVVANINVTAIFAINTYTLTYTAGAHGTISGTSPQTVNHGAGGTPVTAVPETGYHFVNWSDGALVNPRTDGNVIANISVTANFAINTYTLTYIAGAHGKLTGVSVQTVNYGASGTPVTAVPDTGYHFVKWSDEATTNPRVDGNVKASITVTAGFAINTYTLTYTAGAHGKITGTSPQTVNHGASGTAVTAVPNNSYHFTKWSDDKTANPRTDINVTANISVTANFAADINTNPGSNVNVQPVDGSGGTAAPVSLTFPTVTQPGATTLDMTGTGPAKPSGFKLAGLDKYYQIATTAVFSGKVTISITYDPAGIKNPDQLKLMHYENGNWVDVTTSLDTVNHIIYGSVSSLSPFGIFEPGLPGGIVGIPYTGNILTSAGTPPFFYLQTAGTLPPGLSLNPIAGVISGTPTAAGIFNFTINILDSGNPVKDTVRFFDLDISTAGEATIAVILQGGSRTEFGWIVPLTVKFFTPGADVMMDIPTYTFNLTTAKTGGYATALCTGVMPGNYDVTAASEHTLLNVKRSVAITAGSNAVNLGTLLEGNANNNDRVNILDFGILATAYGKNKANAAYNPMADFDRNDIVNIFDFGLLATNYLKLAPVEVP